MTKKHFELIAEILRSYNVDKNDADALCIKNDIIYHFADELRDQFPRFDRAKFISAATMPHKSAGGLLNAIHNMIHESDEAYETRMSSLQKAALEYEVPA